MRPRLNGLDAAVVAAPCSRPLMRMRVGAYFVSHSPTLATGICARSVGATAYASTCVTEIQYAYAMTFPPFPTAAARQSRRCVVHHRSLSALCRKDDVLVCKRSSLKYLHNKERDFWFFDYLLKHLN